VSLSTPQTVRKLQAALHAKAKGSPTFRFYSLYDKVCRMSEIRESACRSLMDRLDVGSKSHPWRSPIGFISVLSR